MTQSKWNLGEEWNYAPSFVVRLPKYEKTSPRDIEAEVDRAKKCQTINQKATDQVEKHQ
jgi:hypothetical protein